MRACGQAVQQETVHRWACFGLDSVCGMRQDMFQQNPMESQEYRAALARTRQAISVQKAIQLRNEGSQARCAAQTPPRRRDTEKSRVLHKQCSQGELPFRLSSLDDTGK